MHYWCRYVYFYSLFIVKSGQICRLGVGCITRYFFYFPILFCAILNILFKIFSNVQKVEYKLVNI